MQELKNFCLSLAEISYGTANGFLTSQLYPGNIPVFTIPDHYSDVLTQDRWAGLLLPIKWFSPGVCGSVSFSNVSWESHPAQCHQLVFGQHLVPASIALGTQQMPPRTQVPRWCSVPQLRRALAPAGERQAGEDPSVGKGTPHRTHRQASRTQGLVSKRTTLLRIQSCFPLQQH